MNRLLKMQYSKKIFLLSVFVLSSALIFVFVESNACYDAGGIFDYGSLSCDVMDGVEYAAADW